MLNVFMRCLTLRRISRKGVDTQKSSVYINTIDNEQGKNKMSIKIQVCGSEVQVYDDKSDAESVLVKTTEHLQGIAQFSLKDLEKAIEKFKNQKEGK